MPQDASPVRSRTATWPAPAVLRRRRLRTSGLDFFRDLAASPGPQVPLYEVMGFRLADVGEGWSRFECTPGEHLCNPLGTIHGGLPAALIDSATGVSIQSTLEAGYIPATIRLHVDFVRAITADTGPLVCDGRIAKPGRQIALADATLTDAAGRLYARGQATFAVSPRRRKPGPGDPPADDGATGSRAFGWADPAIVAGAARTAGSGLDYMRAIARGDLPPPAICDTLDFALAEVERGRAVFACTPQEMHYNPMGTVHGGLAATLIDSATGCAVHSRLDKGYGFTTVYLTVEYLRGLTDRTGVVRATGRVVKSGAHLVIADAELADGAGTVYARGTATCMIFPFPT